LAPAEGSEGVEAPAEGSSLCKNCALAQCQAALCKNKQKKQNKTKQNKTK
jgi:hypothetical protein